MGPPSTPVKKGATPKVSEVNVRHDVSVIESTPANLLKKSLLRKAMEEEKDAQFSSPGSLLKSHEAPLVEEYALQDRTSPRESPTALKAAAEALKSSPLASPETPKSTKTQICETPTTSAKKVSRDRVKTPAKLTWSARGLHTPSPKSSEKPLQFTPAKVETPKAATKVATPKKTPTKVLVTPRRSLGRAATPKVLLKATPAKKTPAKAATPKAATKVATPKNVKKATPAKKTPVKAATPKSAKKVATPKSVKKATPKKTPAKAVTPKSAKKVATPKKTPVFKLATPKSAKKAATPKKSAKKATPQAKGTKRKAEGTPKVAAAAKKMKIDNT